MTTANRIIVIVLDSVGIGETPDAATSGDVGVRESFADLAATIADMLAVKPPPQRLSFTL